MQLAQSLSRLGTETAFQVSAGVERLKREGHHPVNLGVGQPDFKTAPHIVEAAVKALRDGQHGYTLPQGILPLRETVSQFLFNRYQANVSPEHIMIVPGGKVTMFLAAMIFGEKGKEIIYPNPGFPIYESVIRYSGATAVPVPLQEKNNFEVKADDILSKITPKTSLIILNTPSNPLGSVMEKTEMDKLVVGLEKFPEVVLMVDEIYSQQTYDGFVHHSILNYEHLRDRVIMLDGWSKTWAMTGWRLGFGVWPAKLIEKVDHFCVNIHSCVNSAAQFAAIAAMEGPQDSVHEMVEIFDQRRRHIVAKLNAMPGMTCATPKGAFYVFPNISALGQNSRFWQNKILEEAHVGTIAGTSFGAYGEGYLRLSYASSMEDIDEALVRIEKLVTQYANDHSLKL